MKLKYYLRGLGIGILASTIILMISFSRHPRELSDKEIISRAQELGMVMGENKKGDSIPRATESAGDTEQEVQTEEVNQQQPETESEKKDSTQVPEEGEQGENDVTPTEQAEETGTEGTEPQAPEEAGSDGGEVRMTEFTVADGESAFSVARRLGDEGLVDDWYAFITYLKKMDYVKYVLPGTIQIPEGADYVEIGELLTNKR